MCARRCAPNAHASLRICLPAHKARRWSVTPRTCVRPGRYSLRLAMPVRALRALPATARCGRYLPAHTARTLYAVTPPDAPRAGRQFLRLAMPVQVLRTFPATARCALVSPAALLGAVCSHAFRRAAAGRYSLRLTMPACVLCTPCRHSSLREIPPCGAARRSSLSSANTLPFSAPGGGHSFAPSGAREDPGRRTASIWNTLSCGRDSSALCASE